jgi:copper homeostasis protein CutC
MKKTLIVSVLTGTFALAGCAGQTPAPQAAGEKDFKELVAQAEQEIKLAAKTGFLWNNTEKFLEDAKTAQAEGDMNKAMKLAKQALEEARLAQKQAKSQANAKANYSLTP